MRFLDGKRLKLMVQWINKPTLNGINTLPETLCTCPWHHITSLDHNEFRDALRWRHNDHAGVSNHQPHGCLLNRLLRRKSQKTSKLRVTGLCAGNSPGTGEFPAQMASYAENVSIWWRHHGLKPFTCRSPMFQSHHQIQCRLLISSVIHDLSEIMWLLMILNMFPRIMQYIQNIRIDLANVWKSVAEKTHDTKLDINRGQKQSHSWHFDIQITFSHRCCFESCVMRTDTSANSATLR